MGAVHWPCGLCSGRRERSPRESVCPSSFVIDFEERPRVCDEASTRSGELAPLRAACTGTRRRTKPKANLGGITHVALCIGCSRSRSPAGTRGMPICGDVPVSRRPRGDFEVTGEAGVCGASRVDDGIAASLRDLEGNFADMARGLREKSRWGSPAPHAGQSPAIGLPVLASTVRPAMNLHKTTESQIDGFLIYCDNRVERHRRTTLATSRCEGRQEVRAKGKAEGQS